MMAMLPAFILGLVIGIAAMSLYIAYKKDTPSDVKIHLQEADIVRLQEDIKELEESNRKLEQLNKELREKKAKNKKGRKINDKKNEA